MSICDSLSAPTLVGPSQWQTLDPVSESRSERAAASSVSPSLGLSNWMLTSPPQYVGVSSQFSMACRMASMVSAFLDGGRYTETRRQVLSPRLMVAATAHPGTRSSAWRS
eukprot:9476884-Pyramimonas_sp.AAC.1